MAAALGLAPAEDVGGIGGGESRSGEVGKTGGSEERHRLCRLRRYNRYTGQGEETFGGREHLSLKMLGLGFLAFFFSWRVVCVMRVWRAG